MIETPKIYVTIKNFLITFYIQITHAHGPVIEIQSFEQYIIIL